jgi:heme-degrading monooxygenase HmoA
VITFWETAADCRAWTESDEFKEGHARSGSLPPETFLGHPKIEMYEVIQSTATIGRIDE